MPSSGLLKKTRDEGARKGLLITIGLTTVIMIAEFVGGIWSNSLALLSDAGHMLTDVLALAMTC